MMASLPKELSFSMTLIWALPDVTPSSVSLSVWLSASSLPAVMACRQVV